MKTQSFVCFILAVFGLLSLSSCTVVMDGNCPRPGFTPVHVGTFGPGQSRQYRPIGGTIIAAGGITTGSFCQPGGMRIQGGYRTFPLQPGWGNVYPYGSPCGGRSGNFIQGGGYPNRAGCGQANWYPPVYGPRPGCYDPRSMRWH